MQTVQSNSFYCKITLHVSGVTAPIIRILTTVTAACGTGHNIGTATSFQLGQVWTSPDLATLEGSSWTDIMTCTGGCG
jgi:hypothetical protein